MIVPTSGPYLGTWDALILGTQHDDGYELMCTIQGQEINQSDAFGLTLVEAIYRGQNWKVRFNCLEWADPGPLPLWQMFGQVAGVNVLKPALTNIGDRWTKFCQTLILTAILGNPPSTPQSLTALTAGVAPQYQSIFALTSKMRQFPFELVLLPYQATINSVSFDVPFTTT